ncbi:MAG: hypothetical protein AAB289_00215, partial [Chloroflexota bacterium]
MASVAFTHNADFHGATFTQDAVFHRTGFGPKADARASGNSPAIADFRWAEFKHPEQVHFYQTNQESRQGLRARLGNCLIAGVRFEDVNWHREGGRLVLQDELDRGTPAFLGYEVVAIAYRRLSENCDKACQYDLAEDCFIGAMEMKRLDPRNFILGRWDWAREFYERHRAARTLGEWLSVLNLYRLASNYGSSYTRALGLLLCLLLLFALLYPAFGLHMPERTASPPAQTSAGSVSSVYPEQGRRVPSVVKQPISWSQAWQHPERIREVWGTLKAGLWAALEVATFQRNPTVEPATIWGRRLAVLEIIAIPG